MRNFNDFEVIRAEIAERQAAASLEARETGNHSPNVILMSGMINMQQIRNSEELLADRANQRRVEASRKLVRLSSVDQRDLSRRKLLALMDDEFEDEDFEGEDFGGEGFEDEGFDEEGFDDLGGGFEDLDDDMDILGSEPMDTDNAEMAQQDEGEDLFEQLLQQLEGGDIPQGDTSMGGYGDFKNLRQTPSDRRPTSYGDEIERILRQARRNR